MYFIPLTPESGLKKLLQDGEETLPGKTKVKYVEKSGRSLRDSLVSTDPWSSHCGRSNCFPCLSGQHGVCSRQGVVYKITCERCRVDRGLKVDYIWESARIPFDRGVDHLSAMRRVDTDHPLVKNHLQHHVDSEEK